MSLTKLIVGGFRSLRERTEIPIAPLTLLFGPNSAGKSAVLRAIAELQDWLTEDAGGDAPMPSRLPTFFRTESRNAYLLPEPEDYYAEGGEEWETEPDARTPMTIGLEVDELDTETVEFTREVDKATEVGLAAFRAMQGRRLQLEHIKKLDGTFHRTEAVIDDVDLFHMFDGRTLNLEFPDHPVGTEMGELEERDSTGVQRPFAQDAIRLNLRHPALEHTLLLSLAASLGGFEHHVSLKPLIRLDDGWLTIRTTTTNKRPHGWRQVHLRGTTLIDAITLLAVRSEQADVAHSLQQTLDLCNLVVDATAIFFAQLRFASRFELPVTVVSGDRRILGADETNWEFFPRMIGRVKRHGKWVLRRRPDGVIASYAQWLAERCLGNLDSGASASPPARSDDFVNDVFLHDLFATRRYRIRPEVWRITQTPLIERGEPGSEAEEQSLRVSLFLEDAGGRRLNFDEVGSGVSYVLPVLAALGTSERSWIEQPELHLHPSAQCELGDVFIRSFNRSGFSVVETHSEHLLLRILKRIRQTANGVAIDPELRCLPEAVAILYFDPQQDGSTQVRRMRVTRSGDFSDRWPSGFFEERDGELFDE